MSYVSEKPFAIARELRDVLAAFASSFEGSAITAAPYAIDSNGLPSILLGDSTAGHQNAFIEVAPVSTINKDVLGNNQNVYTPDVVNLVLEQLSGNTGTLVLKAAGLLPLLAAIADTGCAVNLYLTINTTAPSVSGITGTPAAVWGGVSPKYPLMAQI
jgi:hypothetical protein